MTLNLRTSCVSPDQAMLGISNLEADVCCEHVSSCSRPPSGLRPGADRCPTPSGYDDHLRAERSLFGEKSRAATPRSSPSLHSTSASRVVRLCSAPDAEWCVPPIY